MSTNMMKAIRIHAYGSPEVLQYENVPRPTPGPGEVLIRVHAVGFNPGDWLIRTGHEHPSIPENLRPQLSLPYILGNDISGIVETVGSGVTAFQKDDAVYGMIGFPYTGGGYAEYATTSEANLARKPETIDHIQAAGVPMAGLTAWQELFEHARLEEGQTILINGAAGGVGHFAVQLAKAKGARVIGVASGRHETFLRGLGVDVFIDYTTTPLEQAGHVADLVLDTVGGEQGTRLFSVLKRGGTLVPIFLGNYSPEQAAAAGVTIGGKQVRPDAVHLDQISRLIDSGHIRIAIDTIFSLSEAQKAHQRYMSHHMRGKIILRVGE